MHPSPRRLLLAAVALCVAAPAVQAQTAPRPEPRVASRESIAAAPDRKIDPHARLALAPDGSGHVLMASIGTAGGPPTLVELVSFDRAGKTTGRRTIASFSAEHFSLAEAQLLRLPSGELLVATPDPNFAGRPGHGALLRLSADGKVLHRAPIHPPHDVPAPDRNPTFHFQFNKMVSTSDGNVVVGGNYGLGPSNWWWGKFTPNGLRLAEQTAKTFFLSTVDALAPTPDGGFRMVSRDLRGEISDMVLLRHSATGARQSRTVLLEKSESHQAAFTSDGRIVVVKYEEPNRLLIFSPEGRLLKEMPWASPADWWIVQVVSDGTGVVLQEQSQRADFPSLLIRLDRDGGVVWQTPQGLYLDAVSHGPEIVALVLEDEGKTATIVRLVNP
ncbi:MAG: hypothetical protein NTV97_31595 [Alphaproteobacteria bacterium]|nr:hypothetical protein [Alphaproteobacteria bacterium]